MKMLPAILAFSLFSILPACADVWSCSAPGLISGNYDGGEGAYIHLDGFSDGKVYPVKKNGGRATGTTGNGTKFVCTKK